MKIFKGELLEDKISQAEKLPFSKKTVNMQRHLAKNVDCIWYLKISFIDKDNKLHRQVLC